MSKFLNVETVQRAIDWACDQALNGIEVGGQTIVKRVDDFADEYMGKPGDLERQIGRMI